MIRLRVNELLERDGRSRYWLWKQLGTSYDSMKKMIDNETQSIRYDHIETLCLLFNVTPNELFEYDFNTEPEGD